MILFLVFLVIIFPTLSHTALDIVDKSCKKRMGDDSASSSAPIKQIKQARTFEIHDDPHDSISILASDDELESDATFEPIEPSALLQHLGEDLETDEKTSNDVTQELAAIVNKRWGKHLSPEKLKAISEKYNRPANCKEMYPQIKVNKEVWSFYFPTRNLSTRKSPTSNKQFNVWGVS